MSNAVYTERCDIDARAPYGWHIYAVTCDCGKMSRRP